MSDFKNSLAYLIANQVPDYIRDEFPQFVLFLEKYYEFLDQDNQANNVLLNAASFSDINKTLDQFIPSFREQYLQMFPKDSLITDRKLIKFIREFYEAKGSEEALHFIFRAFFDEHVDIIYPSQYVLKASDGVWVRKQKIRIYTDDTITLDPFDLIGKRANIFSYKTIGTVASYDVHSIIVENVNRLAYAAQPTYELFVKHEENDYIILPGSGANARALVVDGQIKAVTGDPLYHSHDFNTATAIDYATDIITIPDHGLNTGDCVIYNTNEQDPIEGLLAYRQYFVKVIDQNTLRLYRDKIALQRSSTRTFVSSNNVDVAYNKITVANHGFMTGDMVVYYSDTTSIGGLTNGNVYYIIKIDNNTIKLSATLLDADPRYCSDDTYFAEDYVSLVSYNELDLTSQGVGDYHVLSREYFINLSAPDTDSDQSFIDAMDARGSGYNAVPTVQFISDVGGTGATGKAYLDTSGGIEYVTMSSNGTGYTSDSTVISFNTDAIRTFIYLDGDVANKYGYVTRTLSNVLVLSISGTPNYGFRVGEVYKINEGGAAGQYVYTFPNSALNYFAGDYVRVNVENNASIIIEDIDANGKPTRARIFSPGGQFEQETFTATITSSTGSDCVLQFTTAAITTIEEGYQSRQGMLSDVNKLQDNYYYQNYSYVLRSKVPANNWMTLVKNTVHPAGMAVFGELLIRATLDMGAAFEVVRQPIDFYEFPIEMLTIDEYHEVYFVKQLSDTFTQSDIHSTEVGKTLSDNTLGFTDDTVVVTGKGITDAPIAGDLIDSFTVGKSLLDIPLATDDIYFGFIKSFADNTNGFTDDTITDFYKYLDKNTDTAAPYMLSGQDYFAEDYIATPDVILSAIDNTTIESGKNVADAIAIADSIPYVVISKTITDTVTVTEAIDSIAPVFTIPNDDPIITDVVESHIFKTVSDGVTISDSNIQSVNKVSEDSLPHGIREDISIVVPGKSAQSTLHTMEHTYTDTNKNLAEAAVASDSGVINIQDYWSENYTAGAYVGTEYTF